jgi:hypothetical protein
MEADCAIAGCTRQQLWGGDTLDEVDRGEVLTHAMGGLRATVLAGGIRPLLADLGGASDADPDHYAGRATSCGHESGRLCARNREGSEMPIVHAHLEEPIDQAGATLIDVAASQGYAFAADESGPGVLVFKKGMTFTSLGSKITAHLDAVLPMETRLTFATEETLAVTDWGRGRRAVERLIEALGANQDEGNEARP